ncbi:FtsH protease activity modulator HflK (plasmid) [Pontibacillus sp. ALD_SL1]|uniref:FtsH protease activity modulator HflK n=1 Tax=Pontibacillus sp. ALD_SL1 TaxID=2777185 RepID=UPI001A9737BE|nr:FtsH protease activity modulator HflK [Pontibacillus sp. ALD_SL1]QST02059.1 FtsH protease activity modulator HflK [Pontibacillus sp. ALD_SL1]
MQRLIKFGISGVVVFFIALWGLTGIYMLDDSEQGVVLTFGSHTKTVTKAGLKWHLPAPIQTVWVENVTEPKSAEYGYEVVSEGGANKPATYKENAAESIMLTGDENLVHVETNVQWLITDIEHFFFNVDDPYGTIEVAGEAAIRRVVANHSLDDVLTDKKSDMQNEIREEFQSIVEQYNLGVQIRNVQLQDVKPPEEVKQAFTDVVSAKEEKNSLINKAYSIENQLIPKAEGEASEMKNQAEAYKEDRIERAKGDVAKFEEILKKYDLGKEVTRTRMYLETMERILPGVDKYIVEDNGSTVQFLPLNQNQVVTKE